MNSPARTISYRDWLPIAFGCVLSLALLEFVRTHGLIKLEAAALGAVTSFAYEGDGAVQPLCNDATDSQRCIASFKNSGQPPSILWLGNSQLAAINRVKPGDRTSPALLHDTLRESGRYAVTYAQPNANLAEHGLIFAALLPVYKPDLLVLPVFLDDFREQGVRPNIAALVNEPVSRDAVENSPFRSSIPANLTRSASAEVNPHDATLQRRVETILENWLSDSWLLWKSRSNIRGLFSYTLHQGRNKILGINAQSKRIVNAEIYAEKMQVLVAILEHASAKGVKVLLYVPPYRRDIPGPYVESQYAQFKADLQAMAAKYQAHFADLDDVVPGPEWGTLIDVVYGFEDYDFMHFTADGHKRHAEALARVIRQIGF
jgi:hypothetical protein